MLTATNDASIVHKLTGVSSDQAQAQLFMGKSTTLKES